VVVREKQGRDSDLKKGGGKTTTKYEAAERLVDSFSAIPTEWVQIVAQHTGADFYGILWGTMFIVNDPVDKRWITSLLHPVMDEEDELSGYAEVGDTGIFAFDIDGQIVLGINGAGYGALRSSMRTRAN
jgi:hypothetical protein